VAEEDGERGGAQDEALERAEATAAADADWHAAKEAYYVSKLALTADLAGASGDVPSWEVERDRMCAAYLHGVQWVLFYYYSGAQPTCLSTASALC
jgi:5'-3' exonuclease